MSRRTKRPKPAPARSDPVYSVEKPMKPRLDEVQDGIYRISAYVEDFGISFNQFLLKDKKPMLIHTGPIGMFEAVRERVREVIDPEKLRYVTLLHFESDEWGGMRFLESPRAELVCSRASSTLNLEGWYDLPKKHLSMWEGDRLTLGRMKVRFLMTPHVHHWDSMMVFEETNRGLFPSDLFLTTGRSSPVESNPALADGMIEQYRNVGISEARSQSGTCCRGSNGSGPG